MKLGGVHSNPPLMLYEMHIRLFNVTLYDINLASAIVITVATRLAHIMKVIVANDFHSELT